VGRLHQVTKSKNYCRKPLDTCARTGGKTNQSSSLILTPRKQLEVSARPATGEPCTLLAASHDLNNVLAPIPDRSTLQMKISDERSQRLLQTQEANVKRELLWSSTVVCRVSGERMILQVRHLILEIKQIAKETFPKSIEFYTDIASDLVCLWRCHTTAPSSHEPLR